MTGDQVPPSVNRTEDPSLGKKVRMGKSFFPGGLRRDKPARAGRGSGLVVTEDRDREEEGGRRGNKIGRVLFGVLECTSGTNEARTEELSMVHRVVYLGAFLNWNGNWKAWIEAGRLEACPLA